MDEAREWDTVSWFSEMILLYIFQNYYTVYKWFYWQLWIKCMNIYFMMNDLWINVSWQKQLFDIKHCYKVQTWSTILYFFKSFPYIRWPKKIMTYTFETGVTQKDFILPFNMNFNQNEGQKDFNFAINW